MTGDYSVSRPFPRTKDLMREVEKGLEQAVKEHDSLRQFFLAKASAGQYTYFTRNHKEWFDKVHQRFEDLKKELNPELIGIDTLLKKTEAEYHTHIDSSLDNMWNQTTGKVQIQLKRLFKKATTKQRDKRKKISSAFNKLKMEKALEKAFIEMQKQPGEVVVFSNFKRYLRSLYVDKGVHFKREFKASHHSNKIGKGIEMFEAIKRGSKGKA